MVNSASSSSGLLTMYSRVSCRIDR